MCQSYAALRIHLQVRVKILVAERAFEAARRRRRWRAVLCGRPILISVRRDIGLVVAQSHTDGNPPAVIRRTDVPGVRRVAEQARMIGTSRKAVRRGVRIAIVRRDAQPGKPPWQEGKMLNVRSLETRDPGAAGVDRLRRGEVSSRNIRRRLEV